MTNPNHPNAFRPQGPTNVDVTRLPPHLRQALDRPVALREGEIMSTIVVPNARTVCTSAGRVYAEVESPETKMVGVKMLDTKGVDVIAQLQFSNEAHATLLSRFIEIYKTLGGTKEALLEMYEGTTTHE
jgi:predicted Fe-Mo cluster-binding NifX family protein